MEWESLYLYHFLFSNSFHFVSSLWCWQLQKGEEWKKYKNGLISKCTYICLSNHFCLESKVKYYLWSITFQKSNAINTFHIFFFFLFQINFFVEKMKKVSQKAFHNTKTVLTRTTREKKSSLFSKNLNSKCEVIYIFFQMQ